MSDLIDTVFNIWAAGFSIALTVLILRSAEGASVWGCAAKAALWPRFLWRTWR